MKHKEIIVALILGAAMIVSAAILSAGLRAIASEVKSAGQNIRSTGSSISTGMMNQRIRLGDPHESGGADILRVNLVTTSSPLSRP